VHAGKQSGLLYSSDLEDMAPIGPSIGLSVQQDIVHDYKDYN